MAPEAGDLRGSGAVASGETGMIPPHRPEPLLAENVEIGLRCLRALNGRSESRSLCRLYAWQVIAVGKCG